jgi:ribonucleotide monophosphatase NagD (HAD superfamily)
MRAWETAMGMHGYLGSAKQREDRMEKRVDKFAIGATMFIFTEDEKHRAHETSVMMGCDAMRICMNMDTVHFPHEEVISLMNSLRRDSNRTGSPVKLIYDKATKKIQKVRQSDGLVIESFDPPSDCE